MNYNCYFQMENEQFVSIKRVEPENSLNQKDHGTKQRCGVH
jgi:hypothetical protein